jgi:tripartite-type tricarboxylate transporter receptor subunit TctC
MNITGRQTTMLRSFTSRQVLCRQVLALAAAALALVALPPAASAQKYPERPVRLVLPLGAAGVGDITARIIAERLGDKLGQRFVIENMPGPGGIVAGRAVLSAPADGYTLLLMTGGIARRTSWRFRRWVISAA